MTYHALPTSARHRWADLLRRLAYLIEPKPRPAAAPDPQDAAWGAAIRKMADRMKPFYREQGYTA